LKGTFVKLRLVATMVLGVAVLTGCSDSPKLAGSAAVVNGKAIPVSAVSDRVDKVRAQIQVTDPTLITQVPSLMQISQRAVDHFVLDALLAEVVIREGIKITDLDVSTYRDDIYTQYAKVTIEAQLASQNSVPADDVNGFMYEILVQRALMQKLAPGADKQTSTKALFDYLTNLSQELNVELNPRFGAWDPSNLMSKPGDKTLAVPLPISLG
jgi:outer membrane murein-binding lipoprotein Lpp